MDEILTILGQLFSPQGAFTVCLLMALILYIRVLRRISAKARAILAITPDKLVKDKLSDTELDRYSRHIILREIGGQGQSKLRKARVLVVGAGGLGSPVLSYLAAAGVGVIGVIDDDIVSLSNLQRQVLFDEDQLDTPKVFSAQAKLKKLNPFVEILPFNRRLNTLDAETLFCDFDLIIDGTDNFATRQLVNSACVKLKKPLILGAITQWEGQVSVFNVTQSSPCYACVFPTEPASGLAPDCASAGVMGALPGVIGSMMAAEAIKQITGAGKILSNQMLIFDILHSDVHKINISKNSECQICNGHYDT